MILPLFYSALLTILCGIAYGFILYSGKMYLLTHNNPIHDFMFTLLRFSLLILLFYSILTFVTSNSILLTILFVSSYLSTVGIIAYKS